MQILSVNDMYELYGQIRPTRERIKAIKRHFTTIIRHKYALKRLIIDNTAKQTIVFCHVLDHSNNTNGEKSLFNQNNEQKQHSQQL